MIKFKNIKLFDLYISQLVTVATLFAIVAFIVVWISPETLFKIITKITYHEVTIQQGLLWLFFEIPAVLGKAIPVGLLLGTLFVTDMLSRNFELVIFRSIGISSFRLFKPVLLVSTFFAIFCLFAYTTFIPYSVKMVDKIKAGNSMIQDMQWSYLEQDQDHNPKQLIIVSNTDGTNLNFINIFQISPKNSSGKSDPSMKNIIFAAVGNFIGDKLIVRNAVVYELQENGIYKNIKHIDKMTILEGKTAINASKLLAANNVQPESLSFSEMLNHLKLLKDEQISDEYNVHLNNLFQRFAQTLSCIVFAFCGLVLGCSRPRENRFVGFTIGAFIIFSYYLVIPFINMLAEKSILPPFITAFLPLFIISVGILFYAKSKDL